MSHHVFINATIINIDPLSVSTGSLIVQDGLIERVGPVINTPAGAEVIDCGGAVVMPGLVNGHTHLYSALAVGMPPPPKSPQNFHEILQYVWWRLDRALDEESIEMSAAIGALDSLHCGTTTLIDHHASPSCIAGSLDAIERGIASVGLRAVLCYETTDRHGQPGAEAGLTENRRYLLKCRNRTDGMFAGLVGAHAAFTMSDQTLQACVQLAAEHKTGVHIHAAEDPCDDKICRDEYGSSLVDRLKKSGLFDKTIGVGQRSILAHATHLSPADAADLSPMLGAIAHNPRSNMNNRVGYAPTAHLKNLQLGTDGIGGDMFTEARHAYFKAQDARANLSPGAVIDMLALAARTASRCLGRTVGKIEEGASADIVVTNYLPPTPMDTANLPGHVVFALGAQHIQHAMAAGKWALRNRRVVQCDEAATRDRSRRIADDLWRRMGEQSP
jgi:putative selenium metabolism protein SsnA